MCYLKCLNLNAWMVESEMWSFSDNFVCCRLSNHSVTCNCPFYSCCGSQFICFFSWLCQNFILFFWKIFKKIWKNFKKIVFSTKRKKDERNFYFYQKGEDLIIFPMYYRYLYLLYNQNNFCVFWIIVFFEKEN